MKERPILFNAEMVRAVLDGRKTQTRRVIKPQPLLLYPEQEKSINDAWRSGFIPVQCPYGKPWDELWVRETFQIPEVASSTYSPNESQQDDHEPCSVVVGYRADKGSMTVSDLMEHEEEQAVRFLDSNKPGWKPSIFMPRWASRIQLRITDVRVERVQEISEEDARTEGCVGDEDPYWRPTYNDPDSGGYPSFKNSFEFLWNSINEKRGYGWDKNPWVWVVEFEVVK